MLKLKDFLQALSHEKVEMIIVGGIAATVHGSSYITNDLDICYKRTKKNYFALVQALTPFNPYLRGPKDEKIPFLFDEKTIENGMNFTLITDAGDIDILGELTGVGNYENLIKSAEKAELYNLEFSVISLDDLINSKRIVNRDKDKVHLDILEALKEMKK